MFPIRDHNPSGSTPFVTLALLAVNIVVFVGYWTSMTENEIGWLFINWGVVPVRILAGDGFETIVTSMFLHGGWMHLAGNMLFLWIFGDNLEEEMGHLGFLVFYLLSGAAAAGLQIYADAGSGIPMVGASGAIAGLMGGYLLLFPRAKVDVLFIFVIFFRIFAIPAWIVLGVWLGVQVFSGAVTPTDAGGVAYFAHVGGFVAGLLMTVPVWLRRGGTSFWQVTRGHPPHPDATYKLDRTRIPTVRR